MMWLRAAAAAVGVGAAVAVAQGVAAADTGDSSDVGHAGDSSAKSSSASASAKPAAAKPSLAGTAKSSAQPTLSRSAAAVSIATKPPAPGNVHNPYSNTTRTRVTQSAVPDLQSTRSSTLDTSQVASLSAQPNVAVTTNTDGSVSVITGTFTDTTVTSADEAATLLNELASVLGAPTGFATASNITVQQVGTTDADTGDIAETFYRFHDSVDGISVLGSEVIVVTDENGTVTGIFNNLDARVDDIDLTTSATSAQAAVAALSAYASTSTSDPLGRAISTALATPTVTPELVVYALDDDTEPQLMWRVVVDPSETAESLGVTASDTGTTYYIAANGANAGTVIVSSSNADSATVTAEDELGNTRTVNISTVNLLIFSLNVLQDVERTISTYETTYWFFIGSPSLPGIITFETLFGWDPEAISAQANIAEAYDYYNDVLGLTSYDGDGAAITLSVRYNPDGPLLGALAGYDNAYWDSDAQQFAFGDSSNLGSALDVVAHEYTHAVVSYAVGDGDSPLSGGESGALNEAYADIMGSLIEGKTGEDRWLIGEDSDYSGGALRNLADPTSIGTGDTQYRDNYADLYVGDYDNGGEHINSTIFSHAAYLMMTDADTADISEETWAMVYYHSLYRLSPGADFSDGRAAVLATAAEYNFTAAQLQAITDAYDSVGIVSTSGSVNL